MNIQNSNLILKPWGSELLLEKNDKYVVKRLTMKAGHRCSLQFHEKKLETVVVLKGRLLLRLGESPETLRDITCSVGDYITVAPKMVHRMEALEDCEYLEASTPELDDVVRLSDDYNRA